MLRVHQAVKLWAFHLLSMFIVLMATWAKTDIYESDEKELDQAFGEVLPMLSLVLTLIMIVSHLQPTLQAMVIGTRAETSITLVCLAFSITLVAIITGPGHGLAVDNDGSIAYGNQYYFSWVSLFTMLYLTQFLIERKFGINVTDTMRMRSKSFSYWVALVFCSIVVMGSSSEYYGRNCSGKGGNKPQPFCSRTAFGISVGLVGLVFASGIVAMKIMHGVAASYLIEVGFAMWLFILYLLEVGFVTDNQGPGAPLGNLYYFSWISFLLTVAIGNACHEDYLEAQHPHVHEQVATTEMPTLNNVVDDVDADDGNDVNVPAGNASANVNANSSTNKKTDVDEEDAI